MRCLGRRASGLRNVQAGKIGAARPRGFGGGSSHAVTPLVTVHARIFKEDSFLAPLVVLALAALIGLLQAPTPRRAVLLGVLIGLAAGAKYIGAVMLPFAVVAIVLIPTPGPKRRLARALTVAGMAIATFLIVELPALRHLARFSHGMTFEFGHSLKGHDVPLPLNLTWGVFHLSQSLLANLGLPLLVLGLIGLAAPLIAPSERRMPLVLIASFAVFWYAIHEASPLKPYPDFARYMLPLAPLLAILATSFIYELLARRDRLGMVAAVTVMVAAIPALWISVRTNGAIEDPRAVIPPILAATGARMATDRYADYDTSRQLLGDGLRPTERTTDIVVTSNMTYDRYDSYAAHNAPVLKRPAGYYYELNALPHLDVSNGRPSRGYFNPVLRVVAMDGRPERLDQIAETIGAAAPDFDVRMVRQGPAQ